MESFDNLKIGDYLIKSVDTKKLNWELWQVYDKHETNGLRIKLLDSNHNTPNSPYTQNLIKNGYIVNTYYQDAKYWDLYAIKPVEIENVKFTNFEQIKFAENRAEICKYNIVYILAQELTKPISIKITNKLLTKVSRKIGTVLKRHGIANYINTVGVSTIPHMSDKTILYQYYVEITFSEKKQKTKKSEEPGFIFSRLSHVVEQ